MRILAPAAEKDYYDSLADPTDRQVVWNRERGFVLRTDPRVERINNYLRNIQSLRRIRIDGKAPKEPLLVESDKQVSYGGEMLCRVPGERAISWTRERSGYVPMFVIFCGQVYRGIQYWEELREHGSYSTTTRFRTYWTAETLLADHEPHEPKYRWEREKLVKVENWFRPDSYLVGGLLVDLNTPILHFGRNDDNQEGWHTNARLSGVQFAKVFDPYTAFQELEMYVGGVLVRQEKPTTLTDKQKVAAHGMDASSFRKDPTKVHY